MMDFSPLYDDDVHPTARRFKRDWSGVARDPQTRTLRPVTYYYADFGHTQSYKADDGIPQKPVGYGGDKTVPEFYTQESCNPFSVDVYRVGNIIRENFTQVRPTIQLQMSFSRD